MNPLEHHSSCLIDGHSVLTQLKGYEKDHLVKCQKCSFVFSSKIPTQTELTNHYDGYERNNFISEITRQNYRELLNEFESFRKTGRILDIGCGDGYFLEEAAKKGWEVYGTEYTSDAVSICKAKGINIAQGALSFDNYRKEHFDVITSFEVIEHIYNPQEEIKIIKDLLVPGGLFYVTTPNFNALERYLLKEQYNIIAYPEHLSYYTAKTIKKLMMSFGFKSHRILTTGISLTRIRTSREETDEAFVSEKSTDEVLRSKIEGNRFLQLIKNVIN